MDVNSKTQLLGGLTAEQFVSDYWQRKPLLVRQALPGFVDPISTEELAGLSLEDFIESRLIVEQDEEHPWQLRHGPFEEALYQNLPERNWTVLVQAVDQWLPEVAKLSEPFTFLPKWRMDDVMISYAAPGGSVGPHFDNYDVFLIQGKGRRRWRIGQLCDSQSPLLPHPDLRILADFQQTDEWVLEPGDMLYLPPRIAHYGIALEDCLTYSVGFRAPRAADVLTLFTDFVAQRLTDEQRYSDAGLSFAPEPQQISRAAVERLKALLKQSLDDESLLLQWFGEYMTEPRYPELLEPDPEPQLHPPFKEAVLKQNSAARLAWAQHANGLVLFASGRSLELPGHLESLVRALCDNGELRATELGRYQDDPQARRLLMQLMADGELLWHHDQP